MRKPLTAFLAILALVGCHLPSSLPGPHEGREPGGGAEAPLTHAPALAGRVSFGDRHLQAATSQVAIAATVSLINSGTNQTVSTALTNASGAFVLDFSNGYTADASAVYYLEAIKGLGNNLPGHDAVRVRTIVTYQDGWKSLTNTTPNQGVVVNPATTALAIGAGLRKGEAGFSFASLIGALSGEASDVYKPVDGLSLTDFEALGPLVSNMLAADQDPIRNIGLLPPSTWRRLDQGLSVTAIAPTEGPAGTAVVLTGTGFTSTPGDHAVSFNGATAPVSASNPLSLTSSVPVGATSGETAVRFGNLLAIGPHFTVPVSITSFSPGSGPAGTVVTIMGAGFSETPESNLVRFNGEKAKVTAATPTQLTVQVPVTTSGPVTVAVNGVSTEVARFVVPVSVASLAPALGWPGMTMTIAGSGFSATPDENVVRFNGVPANVTAASPTQLTVSVPVTTSGPVTVEAQGESGTGPIFTFESLALRALYPEAAPPGTSLQLEGTFFGDMTVDFPGGVKVAAEVLGVRRARVVVPPGATAGNLTVSSGSLVSNALRFQTQGAAPALGAFAAGSSLGEARNRAALLRHHDHLFLIGGSVPVGSSGTEYRPEVLRAAIGPSDSLGTFSPTGVSLLTARHGHSAQIIGDYLYVLGGNAPGVGRLASVERARIHPDGSLGSFEDAGVALTVARTTHTSEIVGHYLYVFGGTLVPRAIERAPIQPDGTLGTFESTGVTLPAIGNQASMIIGDHVYLFGGYTADTYLTLNTVNRAPIHPDGTLGSFEDAGISLYLATYDTAAVRLGTGVYLLGGNNTTGEARNTIQRAEIQADGTLGAFQSAGTLNRIRRQHRHVLVGDRLYVLGGNGYDRYSLSHAVLSTPDSAPITSP